jgi:hypothetical protein
MSLASDMGWNDRLANTITAECAAITLDLTINPDTTTFRQVLERVSALDHEPIDKLGVAFAIGMYVGKIAESKGML